jgi:adenylate kinase
MRLMMLGCPGAGKGTQAQFIARDYHIPQISTGEMLRQAVAAGTELGHKAQVIMQAGKLVPDELIIDLVKVRIAEKDCHDGFIFDGFPRTLPQAEALIDAAIPLDVVLELSLEDEEIVHRMSGRLVHAASGRVYHREFNPPKVPMQDDVTGEPLIQRDDDKEETVRKRIEVYHAQTKPLINFYQHFPNNSRVAAPQFCRVSGLGTVEEVAMRIHQQLQRLGFAIN